MQAIYLVIIEENVHSSFHEIQTMEEKLDVKLLGYLLSAILILLHFFPFLTKAT